MIFKGRPRCDKLEGSLIMAAGDFHLLLTISQVQSKFLSFPGRTVASGAFMEVISGTRSDSDGSSLQVSLD